MTLLYELSLEVEPSQIVALMLSDSIDDRQPYHQIITMHVKCLYNLQLLIVLFIALSDE